MQTRTHSFIESVANVLVGYTVAILSQLLVFPMFDINVPFTDNLMIGMWFTLISLVRSYAIRRWFTKRTEIIHEQN